MLKLCIAPLAGALLLACTASASAQHATSHRQDSSANSPAAEELRTVNARMHSAMETPMTGDPDRDFAAAMIPHHEGAIAMAQVQLKYGKDPVLREMAQEIISAQKKEISVLRDYLARPR